jgi:GntR family transcriptional regulator
VPEIEQSLPKYLQIANYIRDQILRGDLRPGAEVPSERQLAVDWNVARPTAARALEALRQQGFVESRQGSGTYVRQQMQPNRRARERYSRARDTGRIYPPDERAQIVAAERVSAPDHVAAALGVDAGTQVVRRQRVTHAADEPVEVSTSWYDATIADRAPRLLQLDRILEGTLVYVEQSTGRQARYARDEACARMATKQARELLRLGRSAAVLVVRHIVYDATDRPIEFAEATYPPDRWSFESTDSIA